MVEKNTFLDSLEVSPFVHQNNENSSDKNINSTNNIIIVKDGKIDNLGENLDARFTAIKNGECLEITIPAGMGEKAFLSENGIKVIQLVSKLGCSKLRIISAKKDVNDSESDSVLKTEIKEESLLNQKTQRPKSKVKKEEIKEQKTKKINKGHGANSGNGKTKGNNKVGKKSDIDVQDQQSVINNTKFVDVDIFSTLLDSDIKPFDDNVFHIAEAIIADALKFGDKKLGSNEKNVSGDDVKDKVRELISATKSSIENMPLSGLPSLLEKETTAFKRATTKLLAKVCENVFNVIRHDKNIQKCVNDLSCALVEYGNERKMLNCDKDELIDKCKNIINIQEKLKKLIENAGHMKSVNEVLNFAFVRVAVDKFYENVDFSDPKVLLNIKSTFNSLYSDIKSVEQETKIDLDAYLNNLIYGFGFYPSSVDVALKELKGENAHVGSVIDALKALSEEYPLTIKSNKKFKIFNTGSNNDRNCAFRAVAVGAGFGPNGYNRVQQKVVDGAEKLRKGLYKGLDDKTKDNIFKCLSEEFDDTYVKKIGLKDVENLAKQYADSHREGFIEGPSASGAPTFLAPIGLDLPLCVVIDESGYYQEGTFWPNCRVENEIKEDIGVKKVYIGSIAGHVVALIPFDYVDAKEIGDADLKGKVSGMKELITKRILGAIKDAIGKKNSVLLEVIKGRMLNDEGSLIDSFFEKSSCVDDGKDLFLAMEILKETRSKLKDEELENIKKLEGEIVYIVKGISQKGRSTEKEANELEDKLKLFIEFFSEKAVEICEKEPLFWEDVGNFIYDLYKKAYSKRIEELAKRTQELIKLLETRPKK